MSIAHRLYEYLKGKGSNYTLLGHLHSGSSMETAETSQVPGDAPGNRRFS